jgi:hypothetical protein
VTLHGTADQLLNELIEGHEIRSFGWHAGQLKECVAGRKSLRNCANRLVDKALPLPRTSVSFVVSRIFFRLAVDPSPTRDSSPTERHR